MVKDQGHYRTRIKFCGMRRLEDALLAVELGVDALGFIFYPPSPRAISITAASELIVQLPPLVTKVGVFVNATVAEVEATVQQTGLDLVQFSGDEGTQSIEGFRYPFIKAFRELPSLAVLQDWQNCKNFKGFLADGKAAQSTAANHYGGSGQVAERVLIEGLKTQGRLILAGGLTPVTVAAACAEYRPFAVDVSSGIESAPGVKNAVLMRKFIAAVNGFDF